MTDSHLCARTCDFGSSLKKTGVVQQREVPQNPDLPYTSSVSDQPNAH